MTAAELLAQQAELDAARKREIALLLDSKESSKAEYEADLVALQKKREQRVADFVAFQQCIDDELAALGYRKPRTQAQQAGAKKAGKTRSAKSAA
jgi:hypothetical protein